MAILGKVKVCPFKEDMKLIKKIFDPNNILNFGKVFDV